MDTQEVQELIQRIRQTYVDYFISTVRQFAEDSEGANATEVKFANVDFYYRNMITIDFLANDDGPQPHFVNSDTYIRFSPDIQTRFGTMDTAISPFKWDEVELKFDTTALDPDLFDRWFESWFDPENKRDTDAPPGNIIHSALLEGGKLTIDFGTAEVDAFWHLMNVLMTSGVLTLAIGIQQVALPLN